MNKQFYIGLFIGIVIGALVFELVFGLVRTTNDQRSELATAPTLQTSTNSVQQEHAKQRQGSLSNAVASENSAPEEIVDEATEQLESRSYRSITCDKDCSQNLLSKFLSGYELTAKEINLLTYGSHHVAEILNNKPDLFEDFQASVFQGLESDAQFALLRVIYHLPRAQSTSFVEQLNSGSENDRANGMKLLAMLSKGQGDFAQRIETAIQTETSPTVLIASIDALNSVSPDTISDATLSTMSDLLLYSEDQALKGKALESLTELQHYDNSVQQFIQEGLESSSTELNLSSLHSLNNLLNEENSDQNKIPAATKKRIIEIANNKELPPDLRMQALSMMNTYMRAR